MKYQFTLPEICNLPKGYRIDMTSASISCPCCGSKLIIEWTDRVHPKTLYLGSPLIVLHIKQCKNNSCKMKVYPEDYLELSPLLDQYSYDCMVEVGCLRLENHQDSKIAEIINEKYNLKIPLSTISHLANKFLDYFAESHYTFNQKKIRNLIEQNGGYILHIDGTCEGNSPSSFVIIDSRTNIILASDKFPTENKNDIKKILKKCVNSYGMPLAVVADLSDKIRGAFEDVIGKKVPYFICQFHFLENLGKKLLKTEYSKLVQLMKKMALKSQFAVLRKSMGGQNIDKLLDNDELLAIFEDNKIKGNKEKKIKTRRSMTFCILKWIADYKHELNGEYFPFSTPDYELALRFEKVYKLLGDLVNDKNNKLNLRTLQTIFDKLKVFFDDKDVQNCLKQMKALVSIFNETRTFLEMQASKGEVLCRQNKDIENKINDEIKEDSIDLFIKQLHEKHLEKQEFETGIKKVEDYFEKYKKELTGHVIKNNKNDYVNVFRTNNISEHFFGKFKRNIRKRVGSNNLKRQMIYLNPNAMLVQNLLNEDYLTLLDCSSQRDIIQYLPMCDKNIKKQNENNKNKIIPPTHIPFKVIRDYKFVDKMVALISVNLNYLYLKC